MVEDDERVAAATGRGAWKKLLTCGGASGGPTRTYKRFGAQCDRFGDIKRFLSRRRCFPPKSRVSDVLLRAIREQWDGGERLSGKG